MYYCVLASDYLIEGVFGGYEGKKRRQGMELYLLDQILDFTSQRIFFAFGCCGGRECAVELGLGGCADVGEEVG